MLWTQVRSRYHPRRDRKIRVEKPAQRCNQENTGWWAGGGEGWGGVGWVVVSAGEH